MNVAREKLLRSRGKSYLHEQIPCPVAKQSSPKHKRVYKQSFIPCNNEKDFIHPPLPVRKNKRFCAEFMYKRPRVSSHRSAYPNASYLKLTKSFFGSESFASLRSNLVKNQKENSELNQTGLEFAPKITSTPNLSVNNQKGRDNVPVLTEVSELADPHSSKGEFGEEDFEIHPTPKLLSNDRKRKNQDIREPEIRESQTLDYEFFGDETSLLGISNAFNVDKTTLSTSDIFNNKDPGFRYENQFTKLNDFLDEDNKVDTLRALDVDHDFFQSDAKCRQGMHDNNFLQNVSSSNQNDSIAAWLHDNFPRIRTNFGTNQDVSTLQSFEVNVKKEERISSHFKDVADMTGFGDRINLLNGASDGLDYAGIISEMNLTDQGRYKLNENEFTKDFTVNELFISPIHSMCRDLHQKKHFNEVRRKTLSKKIAEQKCFSDLTADDLPNYKCQQEGNFDRTEVDFDSHTNREHLESTNFELPPTDVTWEPRCPGQCLTPERYSDDTLQIDHENIVYRTEQIIKSIEKDLRESPTFRYSPRKMFW